MVIIMPGTPNNPWKWMELQTILKWMFGETTIFHGKILNHPIETTVYKWMFQVRGFGVSQKRPNSCFNTKHQTKYTPKNGAPSDPQKIQPNTATHNSSVWRWDFVVQQKLAILSRDFGQNFVVKNFIFCQTRNPRPQGTSIGPIHMLEHHILSVERKDIR